MFERHTACAEIQSVEPAGVTSVRRLQQEPQHVALRRLAQALTARPLGDPRQRQEIHPHPLLYPDFSRAEQALATL